MTKKTPVYTRLYTLGVLAIAVLAVTAFLIQSFFLGNIESYTTIIQQTQSQMDELQKLTQWAAGVDPDQLTETDREFFERWLDRWTVLNNNWTQLKEHHPKWSRVIEQLEAFEVQGLEIEKLRLNSTPINMKKWLDLSSKLYEDLRTTSELNLKLARDHVLYIGWWGQGLLISLFVVLVIKTLFVFRPMHLDLQSKIARFKAALLGSLDAVFFLKAYRGVDGEVVDFIFNDVNAGGEELTGRTKDQLIGQKLCELFPINRTAGFFEKYKTVLETRQPLEEEFPIDVLKGKGQWLRHQVVAAQDGICITTRDITDKKMAEMALFSAEKMKSLGEMASSIAHEINNPLTIITGRASQLHARLNQSPVPDQVLVSGIQKIEATALRIAKIVKSLRIISKDGERVAKAPFYLATIVDDTLELCRERFRNYNVDLRIGKIPNLMIECSNVQVTQALLNLINNAYDAALSGPEPRWVEVAFVQKSASIQIQILDSGEGFEEDMIEKVMLPFFTTKEVGTGLGLSISKTLVMANKGSLTIDTSSPHTCFLMEFPILKTALNQLPHDKLM